MRRVQSPQLLMTVMCHMQVSRPTQARHTRRVIVGPQWRASLSTDTVDQSQHFTRCVGVVHRRRRANYEREARKVISSVLHRWCSQSDWCARITPICAANRRRQCALADTKTSA